MYNYIVWNLAAAFEIPRWTTGELCTCMSVVCAYMCRPGSVLIICCSCMKFLIANPGQACMRFFLIDPCNTVVRVTAMEPVVYYQGRVAMAQGCIVHRLYILFLIQFQ